MNRRELTFAGRICSIDRLTGESASAFVRKYQNVIKKYLDIDVLCGILDGEKRYQEEYELLLRAKELSLSESDRSQKCTTHKNLTSVFSRISVNHGEECEKAYYRLRPLGISEIFPERKISEENLESLRTSFYREMDELSVHTPKCYEDFMIVLDRIFLKYLWCITSSDYEGEDISLYDHLKITEAILNCLVQTDASQSDAYCLLMGDFSGIQKYIFGIASINQSGVAKRLRARSFYVDMLIRVFAKYVTEKFQVTRANILLQTGGKFYLLLPASENLESILVELRKELDIFLYENFHGAISLNLAWLKTSDEGLRNYSETIVQLNELLKESRFHGLATVLQDADGWNTENFILYQELANRHVCKGCGVELISKEKELCLQCSQQVELGRALANAKYIIYERTKSEKNFRIFKDYYIRLSDRAEFMDGDLVEVLNDGKIPDVHSGSPILRRYLTNHVPKTNSREISTFSDIAKSAKGMNKLGVLKADVDILGYLFSDGFRRSERHYGTISRVNTMSRMLEMFFSGYINEILEKDAAFKNVYSVFSGGDDLFLIGPWNVMSELAIKIRESFRLYTGCHPGITMSASVTLFHEKEHIAFMAEHSEKKLSYAKDGDSDTLGLLYPGKGGRDCICFMDDLFTWEDLAEQMQHAKLMSGLLEEKKIRTGILNRISIYCQMYRKFLCEKDVFGLMFDPLLAYDRNRNYKGIGKSDEEKKFIRYVMGMEADAANYRKPKKDLYYAGTTVKCALYMTRTERTNEK